MKAIAVSKQGSRSAHNEDACLVLCGQGVFVVADGVGGGPAGQMASRCLVDVLAERFGSNEVSSANIVQALEAANEKVRQVAFKSDNNGMASTLVLAWIEQNTLHCFHVGDSRIYRSRQGALVQLTRDHIRSVRRANGGMKTVVTQAVGARDEILPDVSEHLWQAGDVLLLMSDGISDMLADDVIEQIVNDKGPSMAEKAHALISRSEQLGGSDDKTVVIVFE